MGGLLRRIMPMRIHRTHIVTHIHTTTLRRRLFNNNNKALGLGRLPMATTIVVTIFKEILTIIHRTTEDTNPRRHRRNNSSLVTMLDILSAMDKGCYIKCILVIITIIREISR